MLQLLFIVMISGTHSPIAIVNGELHYLTDDCGGEDMHEVIASNFIELLNKSRFGMAGACSHELCTIDNVRVECGEQTGTRRRRDTKVPLTVKFALKVPLPSNASEANLDQTTQELSSDLLTALNETDLDLNIDGVVIEYDTSKPPVFRVVGLVCDKGQVLRGTKCGKTHE